MKRAPLTALLIDIFQGIQQKTDIPTFQKLPDLDQAEPFVSFGSHFDDDSRTGKHGGEIVTTDLQLDMYYPIDSRIELEDAIYRVKSAIKQSTHKTTRITSQVLIDNSIGRELYHVVFIVTAYV